MISTIMVGNTPTRFEATLGTQALYEEFTGQNLINEYTTLAGLKGDYSNVTGEQIAHMMEVLKKLAFVMKIQAEATGETTIDKIRNIRSRLNADEMLAWQMELEPDALGLETLNKIFNLWNASATAKSEPKN